MMLQSVRGPNACGMVVKTLMFYIVMNLEAFIFCYAGEYLCTKVIVLFGNPRVRYYSPY